jgi:hypothetical protein
MTEAGVVETGEPSKAIGPELDERTMVLDKVKVAVTEPEASLATMSCETGSPGGASTVVMKAPLLSVVTIDGEEARVAPSHFMVIVVRGK